jgi:hypothetical protein
LQGMQAARAPSLVWLVFDSKMRHISSLLSSMADSDPKKPSEGVHHLKFNKDVLPDFKRRPDTWDPKAKGGGGGKDDKMSETETDAILKWIGLVILILVIAGIVGVTLHNRAGVELQEESSGPSAAEKANQERELAKQIIGDYMAAADVSSRLKYVRRPETVKPLMEKYYLKNDIYPLKVWNYDQVEPRSIDGWPFWYAVVSTPEGREIVLLEKIGDSFKVDWETHVGLNPMRPEDYLEERPAGKLDFRVYVSLDSYYNGPFADTEKYSSMKLEFANSGVVIFGYMEKTSPDYTKFFKLVDEGAQVPLILSLEWPEGSEANQGRLPQVRIHGLVSARWLVVD